MMRKIGSEHDKEKKRKRNNLILSIFLLLILVGGTAGYAFITNPSSTPPAENPSGQQSGGRWTVPVDNQPLSFTHSPEEVHDVPVDLSLSRSSYLGNSLYLTSSNPSINSEIASTLGIYASRVQPACYGACDEDLPEKNCADYLIVWKDSTENKVYQQQNCVFIEGDMRAVDAFLYRVLGITTS